ncbi:MAG TPA: hypothetical protein ENO08_05220, partial [Candidatus Eisenbacteria bacterium]|nr:hypothetical protein [Candidatus Eisenbacteria bacterium]
MDAKRENKIFLSVLWTFLLSSLAFFFIYISAGGTALSPSVWFMFLLLDAGFVVFLFVPLHGRQKAGGRKAPRRQEWYPRDLGEIVEKRPGAVTEDPGMLRPGRAVGPVPLVPLLILLAVILLAAPFGRGEEAWSGREAGRLTAIYEEAAGMLAGLERTLGEAGSRAAELAVRRDITKSDDPARIGMI